MGMRSTEDDGVLGLLLRDLRRQKSLSKQVLAERAGFSLNHLRRIEACEQTPDAETVLRIAQALGLPPAHRQQLVARATAAGKLRWYDSVPPLPADIRPVLEKALTGHEPYPAMVTDSCWNIAALNHTMEMLMSDVAGHLLAPPNFLRIILHPEGLAPHLTNLPQVRYHVIRMLRRWSAITGDGRLRELEASIAGLPSARDAELATSEEAEFTVSGEANRLLLPIELYREGHLMTFFHIVTSFGERPGTLFSDLPSGPLSGIALESFLPANTETRVLLGSPAPVFPDAGSASGPTRHTPPDQQHDNERKTS
ncbi:helix-turn-helix domain-containing protein [Streptomyces atratus]|uniref:helix-turn-helix domain-containing protein n=1 Tax=Streptomyces atratus TaxID=1893 RepID=UPI0022552230|nr:helix-turn-helix domain-containing protein [Streptomyces atratus]MCX5343512.1 helix-turn-helix domain-containing protein [Streptomyces atratus]